MQKEHPIRMNGCSILVVELVYLRRPRMMRTAPDSSARALPAELASISGTAATADMDAPANRSIIPSFLVNLPPWY